MRDQMVQCGRKISSEEMELICKMVELFPRLALKELAATICEHLGWYTAAGNLKEEACLKLLRKLEAQGLEPPPNATRANSISPYQTVEEEQQASSKATLEHARIIRSKLWILMRVALQDS